MIFEEARQIITRQLKEQNDVEITEDYYLTIEAPCRSGD